MRYQHESEEDTKQRIINDALAAVGWSRSNTIHEYSLRQDRNRIVRGKNYTELVRQSHRDRPDYILCKSQNVPLAVVEAKRSSKQDSEGLDQAKIYAQMLGVDFAYSTSGNKFWEHDFTTGTQREINMHEFPSPDDLWRRWCEAHQIDDRETRNKLENALYYTTFDGKTPRYYQMQAINKTVDAIIAEKRKRILLVMATGTGKTYTAFQIIWRLLKGSKVVKNVLYLADRNALIDQTLIGDFHPLEKVNTKIQNRKIDTSHQVYFGLYQQLKGGDDGEGESNLDVYKTLDPNFFDLIIVDECHRGSARSDSSWRAILDYFKDAIQIGLTATPRVESGANNVDYFGEPIYTYSLKQGIEDGFLAPYQVIRVGLNKDLTGWEPEDGAVDDNGREIQKRTYTISDFDRNIILRDRTKAVASVITETLMRIGDMSKTIVFCTTQRHALELRDELRALNTERMQKDPNYIVRMTGDDKDGCALLEDFMSVNEPSPVVVTTSKLLTTGADTKCVKLIVLDANIKSQTEFKQIIGRGTRLPENSDKTFFTILDFRGSTDKFKDPDFDGIPDWEEKWPTDGNGGTKGDSNNSEGDDAIIHDVPDPKTPGLKHEPLVISSGVDVRKVTESVSYLDENGKLVMDKFKDYTRKFITDEFGSEADFLEVWNGPKEKHFIIDLLNKNGFNLDKLREQLGNPDIDEFDLIVSIAFDGKPYTRRMRSTRVKNSKFLEKYQGIAREVMERLLDVYAHEGICEVTNRKVLQGKEFTSLGGLPKIMESFGGSDAYDAAIKDLEKEIYMPLTNNYASATHSMDVSI